MADGSVKACGQNMAGQLGLGDVSNRLSPHMIPGLSNVVFVAAGDDFSMAVLSNTAVMSWGANPFGELGQGFEFLNITNPTPAEI